jgi:hypothetical protein
MSSIRNMSVEILMGLLKTYKPLPKYLVFRYALPIEFLCRHLFQCTKNVSFTWEITDYCFFTPLCRHSCLSIIFSIWTFTVYTNYSDEFSSAVVYIYFLFNFTFL